MFGSRTRGKEEIQWEHVTLPTTALHKLRNIHHAERVCKQLINFCCSLVFYYNTETDIYSGFNVFSQVFYEGCGYYTICEAYVHSLFSEHAFFCHVASINFTLL